MDGRFLIPLAIVSVLSGSGALFFDAGYWRRGWTGSDYPLSILIGSADFNAGTFALIVRSTPAGYCFIIGGIVLLLICIVLLDRGGDRSAHVDRLLK
jgi:hypothetical protein